MAGDWIKFEIGTSDKAEVWAIAQSLNIDPDAVVGKLLRVWAWFDQHTEKGNAPIVTKMLLNRLVGVTNFCESLISVGWMTEDGKEIFLPHFDRHNGKTAKTRAVTAKRVSAFKNKSAKSNDAGNEEVTLTPLPREEKRRENISNTDVLDSIDAKPQKPTKPDYPDWFEQIWEIYPSRSGSNDKRRALHAAQARIKSGKDPGYLLAAVERYSQFVRSNGNWGSQFVMQAATFFGPGEHIDNPWRIQHAASQQRPVAGAGISKIGHSDQVRADAQKALERLNGSNGDFVVHSPG